MNNFWKPCTTFGPIIYLYKSRKKNLNENEYDSTTINMHNRCQLPTLDIASLVNLHVHVFVYYHVCKEMWWAFTWQVFALYKCRWGIYFVKTLLIFYQKIWSICEYKYHFQGNHSMHDSYWASIFIIHWIHC